LSYDERNRLTYAAPVASCKKPPCLSPISMVAAYNARGERVQKEAAGPSNVQTQVFLYSEAGQLLVEPDRDIIYLDNIPVATRSNSSTYPIETDHLGTPRVLQNASGSGTLWTWNLLANSASGSNAFGEQAPTGKQSFSLRFPGQFADGNGLSYNYFRDYEAGTGRYVESDPIGLRGDINIYAYVVGNPTKWIDPAGSHEPGHTHEPGHEPGHAEITKQTHPQIRILNKRSKIYPTRPGE